MASFESIFSSITARYGVYGVLGNHEHYAGQDNGSFFSNSGIGILRDSVVIVGNSFFLAGRYDSHTRTRKSVAEIMNLIPDSLPVILVDHRPTVIGQIGKNSPDGETHLFVSSGIRLWGPPVRTTGKSEIIVIDITLTKD